MALARSILLYLSEDFRGDARSGTIGNANQGNRHA
jgi:hypothetical protein